MTDVRNYYAITTKIFLLRTSHDEWLRATQELYNKVLYFYYRLFLDHPELHSLGDQKLLREMERLSIVGRDGRPVERPLPFEKFPLYFRRAAINAALAAGKSYLAREDQEHPTEAFASGVTLYKGNYKDLDSHSIRLKVWDGEKWRWIHGRLSGNIIPKDAVCLSPRLVFRDGVVQLHVPVRQISRQIVDFCEETGAGVIVLPRYSKEFTKYVMASVGNWSPLRLNHQIRAHLEYKAWQSGILVLESEVSDIERYCAVCGGLVRRRGELFVCENGHQGNRRVNAGVNLGRKTWKSLSKHMSCHMQNV